MGVLSHLLSHCCIDWGRTVSEQSLDACPVYERHCTVRICCPRPHCAEHYGLRGRERNKQTEIMVYQILSINQSSNMVNRDDPFTCKENTKLLGIMGQCQKGYLSNCHWHILQCSASISKVLHTRHSLASAACGEWPNPHASYPIIQSNWYSVFILSFELTQQACLLYITCPQSPVTHRGGGHLPKLQRMRTGGLFSSWHCTTGNVFERSLLLQRTIRCLKPGPHFGVHWKQRDKHNLHVKY